MDLISYLRLVVAEIIVMLREGSPGGVVTTGKHFMTKLMISGKSTADKTDDLFSIFDLILRDANLDSKDKIIEMLREAKSRGESAVQGSGHAVIGGSPNRATR